MSFFPLALAAWVTVVGSAGGQIPDSADAPISVLPRELEPSQHVAAQVRRVLQGNADASDWMRLETALAEIGLPPISTALASRGAPVLPGLGSTAEYDAQRLDSARAVYVVSGMIIVAFLLVVLFAVRRHPARASTRGGEPSGEMDRRSEVRTLVATGVPLSDIARRSGLSRDAVGVLMRIRTS